jgi:hypothetical protein
VYPKLPAVEDAATPSPRSTAVSASEGAAEPAELKPGDKLTNGRIYISNQCIYHPKQNEIFVPNVRDGEVDQLLQVGHKKVKHRIKDRTAALAGINKNHHFCLFLDPNLLKDTEFMKEAMKANPHVCAYLDYTLRTNVAFIKEALEAAPDIKDYVKFEGEGKKKKAVEIVKEVVSGEQVEL